jgi:O-antigen ligase
MRDAFGLPADWLDALPFDSWVIPGILLMALIGVPAFGLLGMYVAGNRLADRLTVAFGIGVMAWIVVQVFFIPFFFLQPVIFVLGLVLVVVAWSRIRRDSAVR